MFYSLTLVIIGFLMKINVETPENSTLIAWIIGFFVTSTLVGYYLFLNYQYIHQDSFNLVNYLNYFIAVSSNNDIVDNIFNALLLLTPLWCLIGIISSVVKVKELSKGGKPVLKTLYTDYSGMKFVYKTQDGSVEKIYPYSEITSFNMTLYTQNGPKGSTCLQSIEVIITTQENKNIKINLYGTLDYVYKFLDLKKYLSNFNYTIDGPIGYFEEKIRHYEFKHKRLLVPKETKWTLLGLFVFIFVSFLVPPSVATFLFYIVASLLFINIIWLFIKLLIEMFKYFHKN